MAVLPYLTFSTSFFCRNDVPTTKHNDGPNPAVNGNMDEAKRSASGLFDLCVPLPLQLHFCTNNLCPSTALNLPLEHDIASFPHAPPLVTLQTQTNDPNGDNKVTDRGFGDEDSARKNQTTMNLIILMLRRMTRIFILITERNKMGQWL